MEEERMNTIKFCLKCGHQLGPDDKFCLGCGANIAEMQAQQSAAGAEQNTAAMNTQATANTMNTQNTQNTQNTFQPQQTQQPNAFQQPAGFQPQTNNFYAAQPQAGFGAPGAAVKKGDNWFAKNLKLIIIIAAALVLCIVGFFVIKHIFFRFQKIDAKDLIKVKFSGVDGAGVATATLNKYSDSEYEYGDGFSTYLGDTSLSGDGENAKSPYFEISESKLLEAYSKAGDIKEAREMRDALRSESAGLKITVNGEEKSAKGLKNDDTVTIKLEFNESYLKEKNIKIENAEYEVTVEGLKNGTKIDMFDGVTVKFEGNDGKGSADLDTTGAKPFMRYTLKDTYYKNLKNGDKVVVVARVRNAQYVDPDDPESAVFVEYDGNYYTADKATMEKEFTVEGLTEMKKVDIFKDITIEYKNAVPYLRVNKINTDNCSEEVKNGVRFYVDDNSKDLKVGDTFKIKAYASAKFTNSGMEPEGTPDEDGYYVKEITVGDDAPKYLGKDADAETVAKFNAEFDKIKKQASDEAVDRTYLSGLSAGGKIQSVTFKDTKTMLFEYVEATAYTSAKCYIVKQVTATVVTDKGNVTAFGLIKLRNPVVTGSDVSVDESGARVTLYREQESLDKALENDEKNYTITTIGAAAKPAETTPTETSKPEETTTPAETKPEETTTTKAA